MITDISIDESRKGRLIHLGCGPLCKITYWEDYDGSWNAWINKFPKSLRVALRHIFKHAWIFPDHVRHLNLNLNLPFQDESCDAIYASHVWEHLYFSSAVHATRECFRVLKPDGVLRVMVPDLRFYCEEYLASDRMDAALQFNRHCQFRDEVSEKNFWRRVYNFLTDFHTHKFMYDGRQLTLLLQEAGFIEIKEMSCCESRVETICQVESEGRVGHGVGIAVEGIKPAIS